MGTTLNNYTIDDFLRIKPVIYEYCLNLVKRGIGTSWYNDNQKAQDLYQEVFIFVSKRYFNKERESLTEGRFIQRMRNNVYWTYQNKFLTVDNKTHGFMNYYEDNEKSLFHFESTHSEYTYLFSNIREHPDYDFYTKGLTDLEKLGLDYYIEGYNKLEISKKVNRSQFFFPNLFSKIEKNVFFETLKRKPKHEVKSKKTVLLDDTEYLKSKITNFNLIFKDSKFITIYSLHLQGFKSKDIAKKVNKSESQVNVEVYRIRQKIKKYNGRQKT